METNLQAMPRGRNQYSGIATLQRISNKCIDSRKHLSSVAIFLSAVPENFCSIFSEFWCDSKNISSTMDCFAVLSSYYAESMYITRGKKTKQIGNQYQRGLFG